MPEEIAGRELRRLRIARGWSQDQVAEHMKAYGYDWHQTQVGRIEAATRPLRLNEAVDLASLYGVSLETLLTGGVDIDADIDAELLATQFSRAHMRLDEAQRRREQIQERWDKATADLAEMADQMKRADAELRTAKSDLDNLCQMLDEAERRRQAPESSP